MSSSRSRIKESQSDAVVVVGESAAGVIGRVDENTLYLAGELGLQRLEGQQVIALDEHIVEDIVSADTLGGVVTQRLVGEQDAGLKAGALVFADPGEFEFLLRSHTKVSFNARS